jgi:oligopeptide/dipeptide ABC transporter ATP-binding protein
LTTSPLLSVRHLVVTAQRGDVHLRPVDDVSFEMSAGESLGLVGESGSGKSLTLRALLGLLPDGTRLESGEVLFEGRSITAMSPRELRAIRGQRIGMVFQDPMTALNPVMSVGDQIAEGPMIQLGLSRRAARARAVDLMQQVGIPDAARRARSHPHEFSGGMRQRVMIAIALSSSPSLLLCDEPTTALDVTLQQQILQILDTLREASDVAVLFVTHDLAVVAQLCESVAVMYAGQLVEKGSTDEVFRRPAHAYTLGLLRSAPNLMAVRTRLETIPGRPPSPTDMPPGCRFRPRCGLGDAECDQERTYPLVAIGPGRESACVHAEATQVSSERDPVIVDA